METVSWSMSIFVKHVHCLNPGGLEMRILALFGFLFVSSAAIAAPPKVTISYSPSLDAACALVRGYQIKEEWKQELSGKVELFSDVWAKIGLQFLSATEKVTGKLFLILQSG